MPVSCYLVASRKETVYKYGDVGGLVEVGGGSR